VLLLEEDGGRFDRPIVLDDDDVLVIYYLLVVGDCFLGFLLR